MKKLVIFLGIILLLFSTVSFSQQDVVESVVPIDDEWYSQYNELLDGLDVICDPDEWENQDSYQQACDSLRALVDSETEKKIALSQHLVDVLHRQGIATNIILILVVIIVISGLLLAAYQLRVAAKSGGPQSSTELEASAAKVRITSSSVGIVVLTISLLFFYLYVKEIYSINVIPLS